MEVESRSPFIHEELSRKKCCHEVAPKKGTERVRLHERGSTKFSWQFFCKQDEILTESAQIRSTRSHESDRIVIIESGAHLIRPGTKSIRMHP